MRELILSKEGIYYYLAGSETGLMDELVNKYDVPLFGHFENHRVDYFDYPDARQFALYLAKSLNLLINENHLNYLITLTGGFPFYLRVLMYELSNVLNERENRFVGKEDVVKALSKSLFSSYAILYKYFEESLEVNLRRKKSGRYYQILKVIGDKKLNVTELSKLTNVRVTSLPTYLEYLVKTELLKKDKEKYYVNDPLMRFWLSNAFEIEESRIMNLEGEIENFNKKVRQMIDTYKSELGLAREAQIRETFLLSNKYKRVRGGMINGVELDIISSEKEKLVLGEIKIKNVTGYDVEKFLRKVKGIKDEVGIKIFVGLMGAEKEAMRLMRREKVKFYDLEAINKIRKEYKLGVIKV
jgi:predicted transcriptional regulator